MLKPKRDDYNSCVENGGNMPEEPKKLQRRAGKIIFPQRSHLATDQVAGAEGLIRRVP